MIPVLSVVVPMYNEEQALPLFMERLRPVLDATGTEYEVVAVDDGSTDLTPAVLAGARASWPQLRVVRLRMNSGHQAALSAGLAAARGDFAVSLDADLQDPPELIPDMLRLARESDVDVVYGVRSDRSTDTRFKRWTAHAFYRLLSSLTSGTSRNQSGDFRLVSRAVLDTVNALPETNRVMRFVVPALGFPSAELSYSRARRIAGRTKYGLADMVQLSLDSITGVSVAPLRLATYTGLLGAMIAAGVVVMALVSKVVGAALPGWASTVAIVSAFSALQLVCLGILGEYIGRTYSTLQNRPTYFIESDSLDSPIDAATMMEDPNGRFER